MTAIAAARVVTPAGVVAPGAVELDGDRIAAVVPAQGRVARQTREVTQVAPDPTRDPRVVDAVRRIVAAYEPVAVWLFGSAARGEAGPDSDIDLLVVVPDDAGPERTRAQLAYEVLRGTGLAVDVIVCTRSYFERRRHLRASLPGTVAREGRLLHAA